MSDSLSYLLIRDLTVVLVSAICAASLCKRVNLSPIVGYLLAGVIVGTPQITFVYVTDPTSVHVLSQLGLIFLMFSIGLSLRIQRLKQIGIQIVAATGVTALLVLTLTRPAAAALGFNSGQALFLAAMLMVSSSAIIGKSLQSQNLLHKRSGQLALGLTLCEDIVAIILLVFLGSYASIDSGNGWSELLGKVGSLFAFSSLLLIPGLVFIPKLLKRVGQLKSDSQEIENILVASLLLGMAIITLLSGYSLAFGAFLCGVIVAEASSSDKIAASFAGIKDLFVAVFFVAIGMQVDVSQFPSAIGLILLGTLLALLLRPFAALASLLLFCEKPKDAFAASSSVTPIGEFSFVIASLGISAGVLDSSFQVAAVGIAFLTALISPFMLQASNRMIDRFQGKSFGIAGRVLLSYQDAWAAVGRQSNTSVLWRLIQKRIPQVTAEFLFASALLVFARPIWDAISPIAAERFAEWSVAIQVAYWCLLAILALSALIALARNINAISMIVADALTQGKHRLRTPLDISLRSLALGALALWILNIAPIDGLGAYSLIAVALTIILAIAFGWRHMVRLHSEFSYALSETISQESSAAVDAKYLRKAQVDWGLELDDWTLNSFASFGKSIGELQIRKRTGANIVGIERHGQYLASVGPTTYLSPGDRVYATGSTQQLEAMRELLTEQELTDGKQDWDYGLAILETATVEPGCPAEGSKLRELAWPSHHGVQVVSLKAGDQAPASPDIDRPLQSGDLLLLVGSPLSLKKVLERLKSKPEPVETNAG